MVVVPSYRLNTFIAIFDSSGATTWSKSLPGDNLAIPNAASAQGGSFAIAGAFWGTIDLGTGIPQQANGTDGFVLTFTP